MAHDYGGECQETSSQIISNSIGTLGSETKNTQSKKSEKDTITEEHTSDKNTDVRAMFVAIIDPK